MRPQGWPVSVCRAHSMAGGDVSSCCCGCIYLPAAVSAWAAAAIKDRMCAGVPRRHQFITPLSAHSHTILTQHKHRSSPGLHPVSCCQPAATTTQQCSASHSCLFNSSSSSKCQEEQQQEQGLVLPAAPAWLTGGSAQRMAVACGGCQQHQQQSPQAMAVTTRTAAAAAAAVGQQAWLARCGLVLQTAACLCVLMLLAVGCWTLRAGGC